MLSAWNDQGLPKGFYNEEVKPMFNRNSGYVFLVNSEYQTAMMNGDKLEIWHNCPNCGHEGFSEDCQLDVDIPYLMHRKWLFSVHILCLMHRNT